VNAAWTAKEMERLALSLRRGRPCAGDAWVERTVATLGMEHTVRPEGQPRKDQDDRASASAAKAATNN
jgi:hypothetical protein